MFNLFFDNGIGIGTAALEKSPVRTGALPVFNGGIPHFNGHLVHGNRAPFSQHYFVKQPVHGKNRGHHSHESPKGGCEKPRDKGGLELNPFVADLAESFDLLLVMGGDPLGAGQHQGL